MIFTAIYLLLPCSPSKLVKTTIGLCVLEKTLEAIKKEFGDEIYKTKAGYFVLHSAGVVLSVAKQLTETMRQFAISAVSSAGNYLSSPEFASHCSAALSKMQSAISEIRSKQNSTLYLCIAGACATKLS